MKRKVVLDTSALFSMEDIPTGIEAYTTNTVLEELEKYGDRRAAFLEHKLKVASPSSSSMVSVEEAARTTGDMSRLSPTDREIIALALEIGGEIWTDDYSIQNVSEVLAMPYRPIGAGGIKKVIKWKYRCSGCGKVYQDDLPDCPICGGQLKTYRGKRK